MTSQGHTRYWLSSHRLAGVLFVLCVAAPSVASSEVSLDAVLDRAGDLRGLRAIVVAQHGRIVAERGYRGHTATHPGNIKSASKAIMAALVGIAIDRGVLEGVDQPIAPLLTSELPPDPDPRLAQVTVGHLLSMQAGLARTSGRHYGRWIVSDNWVRSALAQPFVDDPGGAMQYSTGSSHLLSAILTRTTGRSTLALARDWLGPLNDFHISHWQRDPQGIYFGGNQMAMSARSMLAFGELYRRGGVTADGLRVVSREWIECSWRPRTQSRFTGDDYGYGWFLRVIGGWETAYAWGFGGQMVYVVPGIGLTVAIRSDDSAPAGRTGYRDDLHQLVAALIELAGPRGGV
jgi:CubicO group peptidase (beta-lactamase class C family)